MSADTVILLITGAFVLGMIGLWLVIEIFFPVK